jgi:WG containing repeat
LGKSIFPDSCPNVSHFYEDYFTVEFPHPIADSSFNNKALANADGTIILPNKFYQLKYFEGSNLCMTTVLDFKNSTNLKEFDEGHLYRERHGLFNLKTKKWILDTSRYQLHDATFRNYSYFYFIVQNLKTHKYGIIDSFGTWLTPQIYDKIETVNENLLILVSPNKAKYQLADMKDDKIKIHKTTYAYLSPIKFDIDGKEVGKPLVFFLAKKGKKWGVVSHEEGVLKPFDFDYVTKSTYPNQTFGMVKKDSIYFHSLASFPKDNPNAIYRFEKTFGDSAVTKYETIDINVRPFFVNKADKVVIPPQYNWVFSSNQSHSYDYVFVEDAQKKKQIIYLSTGEIVAYAFDYNIAIAPTESKIIVVKNDSTNLYGVVSKTGKIIVPCDNYSVAIGDREASVFFVKHDVALFNTEEDKNKPNIYGKVRIREDSLTMEDTNWQMYNGEGKILNKAFFRFPIKFNEGIGIGMMGNSFSLFDINGNIVMPFDKKTAKKGVFTEGSPQSENSTSVYPSVFNNITFDPKTKLYTLFLRQGLTTTLMLVNAEGEVVVKAGQYDAISKFYGQYAFVTDKERVGLIDTLGREIFAPRDLRLTTPTNVLMDSLENQNKRILQLDDGGIMSSYNQEKYVPFYFNDWNSKWHPDSLQNEAHRALLWNLMLEKRYPTLMKTINYVPIDRVTDRTKGNIEYFIPIRFYSPDMYPFYTNVSDNTCAFILSESALLGYGYARIFHNFYRRNNHWDAIEINELLDIKGEKRQRINALISQKIGLLKNVEIDCSDASNFIGQVEKHFLLTKEGIDFCFFSQKNDTKLVAISFTWGELSPFLKMKF